MRLWPFKREQNYPFEDIEERQQRLDETRAYVNRWANDGHDRHRSFYIRNAERMAIVNEVLIERSKHEVLFSVERVLPEEFGTQQILRATYDFFNRSRPDGMITFFVHDLPWPEPGSALANLLAFPRVRIIKIDPEDCKHHFAVADGHHYWFEVKNQRVRGWLGRQIILPDYSMGMFGDTDLGTQLRGLAGDLVAVAELSPAA